MRLSQFFLPTLKETPSEAQIVSHRLMLRAGMVRQLSAGIYSWLPLGYRVLKKIEQIVREEQDAIGCNELLMPTIQPAELWQEMGGLGLLGGPDDVVDLAGRDAGLVGPDGVAERGVQALDALAAERRDLQHGRLADEVQPVSHLVLGLGPLLGVGHVPLVEQHDDRAAGEVDPFGEALVLGGHTLGGVDDQDGDVG